jgi:hypothetical protein
LAFKNSFAMQLFIHYSRIYSLFNYSFC